MLAPSNPLNSLGSMPHNVALYDTLAPETTFSCVWLSIVSCVGFTEAVTVYSFICVTICKCSLHSLSLPSFASVHLTLSPSPHVSPCVTICKCSPHSISLPSCITLCHYLQVFSSLSLPPLMYHPVSLFASVHLTLSPSPHVSPCVTICKCSLHSLSLPSCITLCHYLQVFSSLYLSPLMYHPVSLFAYAYYSLHSFSLSPLM